MDSGTTLQIFRKYTRNKHDVLPSKKQISSKHTKNINNNGSNGNNKNLDYTIELPILCVKKSTNNNRFANNNNKNHDSDLYYTYTNNSFYNTSNQNYYQNEKNLDNDIYYNCKNGNNNETKNVFDDEFANSSFFSNYNTKSANNFSKILVTLRIKKETSMKNKTNNINQLPLLKSTLINYSNNNNNLNMSKTEHLRQSSNSETEFLRLAKLHHETSSLFSAKETKATPSQLDCRHEQQFSPDSYKSNKYTRILKPFNHEKSFAWANFDKVLNKKVPENPPATPVLFI